MGRTRVLASNSASAISPKASLATKAGRGKRVGRDKTWPNVLVNSLFVTGAGDTAFMGPDSVGVSRAKSTMLMRSSMLIQLIYCLPDPTTPPKPSLKGKSIFCSAPPSGVSTIPMRGKTVRIPASIAGWAAFSQAWPTSGR